MRKTIRTQLLKSYMLITVIPILILSLLIFYISYGIMTEKIIAAKFNYLQQASVNLQSKMSFINRYVQSLFSSKTVQESVIVLNKGINDANAFEAASSLKELAALYSDTPLLLSVDILTAGNRLFNIKNNNGDIYHEQILNNTDWMDQTREKGGSPYYIGTSDLTAEDKSPKWGYGVSVTLKDIQAGYSLAPIGYAYLIFSEDLFSDIYRGSAEDGRKVFILQSDGQIISSSDKAYLGKRLLSEKASASGFWEDSRGHFTEEMEDEQKMIVFLKDPVYSYYIVEMSSYGAMTREVSQIGLLALFVAAICFIILFVVSSYISSRLLKPITHINRSMSMVAEGNLEVALCDNPEDTEEISRMRRSFNIMTIRLKELFEKTLLQAERNKKIEISLLQRQINPHFLSNTLSSIGYLALEDKSDEVYRVTKTLNRLLQNVIGCSGHTVSLGQELANISDYIAIMNIRYEGAITLNDKVPEELMVYNVPNLLLQPLVENAVFHGMKKEIGQIEITLLAGMDESRLVLEVSDNGCGMEKSRLQQMEALLDAPPNEEEEAWSVGIKNTHDRLRLNYGLEYGLMLKSRPGEGTRVIITMPAIRHSRKENQELKERRHV